MSLIPYGVARRLLFKMDAEHAHDVVLAGIATIQHTPLVRGIAQARVHDPVTLAGITFPNRIGLAAGLDKNGRCIDGFGALGFGFVEVGTVTPLPQSGNPKPRLFRLPQAHALINRLGFNNDGLACFIANVQRAKFRERGGILGLNIGKNVSTPIASAVDDYLTCLTGVYPHADYVSVNISSPNTANLRVLQDDEALSGLLGALQKHREELAQTHGRRVPLFVKIAPDLVATQVRNIANGLTQHGIDGVIATNSTTSREGVAHLPQGREAGGLSGPPVMPLSNRVIELLRAVLGPGYPIIGVGGVMSGADALAKRAAGADLVQIYTGFIYRGPELVTEAARALAQAQA